MLPREILRQIRRLQFRARRAVDSLFGGEYHSVFKGTGMAFEEVRAYQPGDDVRAIDWNVTARMGQPFIKRYVEERELTIILMLDCSSSQQFGTGQHQKREVAAEIAAVIAFSAASNNDKVGLIAFTDQIEKVVPPRKGSRQVLRLIREVLYFQPVRSRTSLRGALEFLNRISPRRAIVFLLSDFLDHGFEKALKRSARHHDLIAVRVTDPREESLPAVGLVDFEDAETGETFLVDTNSRQVRDAFATATLRQREALRSLTRSAGCDLVEVSTDGSHLDSLVRFFQMRECRLRRT